MELTRQSARAVLGEPAVLGLGSLERVKFPLIERLGCRLNPLNQRQQGFRERVGGPSRGSIECNEPKSLGCFSSRNDGLEGRGLVTAMRPRVSTSSRFLSAGASRTACRDSTVSLGSKSSNIRDGRGPEPGQSDTCSMWNRPSGRTARHAPEMPRVTSLLTNLSFTTNADSGKLCGDDAEGSVAMTTRASDSRRIIRAPEDGPRRRSPLPPEGRRARWSRGRARGRARRVLRRPPHRARPRSEFFPRA